MWGVGGREFRVKGEGSGGALRCGAGVWGWRAGRGESLGLRVSGARAGCTDHNWREFRVKGFRSQGWMYRSQLARV